MANNQLRKAYRLFRGQWELIPFKSINNGDILCLKEPDGENVVDDNGASVFRSLSNAYIHPQHQVLTFDSEPAYRGDGVLYEDGKYQFVQETSNKTKWMIVRVGSSGKRKTMATFFDEKYALEVWASQHA